MKNPLDALIPACCTMNKEQDIPRVQAVIHLLQGVCEQIWDDMIDNAAEKVAEAQKDKHSSEWILLLTALLWQELLRAPRREQILAIRQAAQKLGSAERTSTAVEDLLLLLRGKFQINNPAVLEIISLRPQTHAAIREAFRELFGPTHTAVAAIVDMWAYRWNWIGEVQAVGRTRTQAFRYWNPMDVRTTPFCRWLVQSGRIVTVGKVIQQVNEIERAITENNVGITMSAWPMLTFTGDEQPQDFNRLYAENDLGAPPFHWRCRTRLVPI